MPISMAHAGRKLNPCAVSGEVVEKLLIGGSKPKKGRIESPDF